MLPTLPQEFRLARGLAGLLSGIVLRLVAIAVSAGTALGVDGAGIWGIFLFLLSY